MNTKGRFGVKLCTIKKLIVALVRLLKQTSEGPQKRKSTVRVTNKQKEKKDDSK